MEPIIQVLPGYRVYEYLLALVPHEELRHRIIRLKQEFAEHYRADQPGTGRVWLPLARFSQYALAEERVTQRLRTLAMAFPPFKVELRDFGSFPTHTIYINALSKVPVQQLVRSIRSEAQRLMKRDESHKPYFILEPHITLAARLKPWQYEKGWLEYGRRHFAGRFIADKMVLLRRPAGEIRYQVLDNFPFQYLPVTTRQGELF